MERLMIVCLMLSSCLLCSAMNSTNNTGKFEKDSCPALTERRIKTATYNVQIDIWGKHVSGLMVFKAITDTTERLVFITETGFKYFDFEFTPHSFSVKYCIPGMNKKIIIKTLERDLGYLTDFRDVSTSIETQSGNQLVHQFRTRKRTSDYFITDSSCSKLIKIAVGKKHHKNLTLDFDGQANNNHQTIYIHDFAAHLKIHMKQIDK